MTMARSRRTPVALVPVAQVVALASVALVAALGLAVGVARPASAAAPGDRITSYDIEARMRTDGSMAVRERFTYSFVAARPDPLYWGVPIRLTSGDTDGLTAQLVSVEDLAVRMDGRSTRPFLDHQSWWYSAWIGSGGRTPAGRHTYELTYVLRGMVTLPEGRPTLWWNAVFARDEPIDQVRLSLTTPGRTGHASCTVSSDAAPCRATTSGAAGHTVTYYTATDLPGRSGVTAYAELPATVVAEPSDATLPGVRPTLRSNLSAPGAGVGLPAGAVHLVTAVLLVAGLGVLVVVRRRLRGVRESGSPPGFDVGAARARMRDAGALVALGGLVAGYLLAPHGLLWWALPVLALGLALVVLPPWLVPRLAVGRRDNSVAPSR
jgi:hypothetical protein